MQLGGAWSGTVNEVDDDRLADSRDVGEGRHGQTGQTRVEAGKRQPLGTPTHAQTTSRKPPSAAAASQPASQASQHTISQPAAALTFFQGRPVRGCPSAMAARSTASRWAGVLWSNTLTRAPAARQAVEGMSNAVAGWQGERKGWLGWAMQSLVAERHCRPLVRVKSASSHCHCGSKSTSHHPSRPPSPWLKRTTHRSRARPPRWRSD